MISPRSDLLPRMAKSLAKKKPAAAFAAGDDESARGRLLNAATRLFCKNGINATGIDAIIDEAGTAKTTLYKLFGSKTNLVHADGSAVTGKAIGNAPGATANDIPLLKLEVVARRGSGTLANIATVQRINTVGGKLDGACDKAGTWRSVPYSADYVFLRKG